MLRSFAKEVQKLHRDAFNLWRLNAKAPDTLDDETRAQKLRNALSSIPRRTLREAMNQINDQDNHVKRAIRILVLNIQNGPKNAFTDWKLWLQRVK